MRQGCFWMVCGWGMIWGAGCGVPTEAEIDPIVEVRRTDGGLDRVLLDGEEIKVAAGTNITLQVDLDRDVARSACVWSSSYSDHQQIGFEYNETFERTGNFRVSLSVGGKSRAELWVIVSGSSGTVIDDPSFKIISDGFIILGETGEILDLSSRQVAIVFGKVLVLDGGGMVTGGHKPYSCRWEDERGVPFWWQFKLDCSQPACTWLLSCCDPKKIFLVIIDARGQNLRCPFIIIPPPATPPVSQAPNVWLKANGQENASSVNASQNGSAVVRLEWGSDRATALVASSNLQSKEFDGPVALSGVRDLILGVGTYIFRVDGVGPGGAKGASVAVTVKPYQPPSTQPGDGDAPTVKITWPLDGTTFVRNNGVVTIPVKVEVWNGQPPFTYRVKFQDEHTRREYTTNARAWEINKVSSVPTGGQAQSHQIYADVVDGLGRVSNLDSIIVNVN